MTKKILIGLLMLISAQFATNAQYYQNTLAPNATKFLPGPPAYTDTRFAIDMDRYFNGKFSLTRDLDRKEQIKADVPYGAQNLVNTFAHLMGYKISYSASPSQWTVLYNGVTTVGYGADVKYSYARKRPCTEFNYTSTIMRESTNESISSLKNSYSYPSAHSMTGWGYGMLLAGLNPCNQDTILARAYEYGNSRVLGAMHWQSDVDDARLIAACGVAHMLNVDLFRRNYLDAIEEASKMIEDSLGLKNLAYEDPEYFAPKNMPNVLQYVPKPCDMTQTTPQTAYDLAQYQIWGKGLRDTERGQKARFDTSNDLDVLINEFAHAIGSPIDSVQAPALYALLKAAAPISDNACKIACDTYNRIRPFKYFNEEAYTFEDQSEMLKQGSYPSVNASRAWTTALLMAAVAVEKQDTIFKVGYELGQSCVIAGINWQSDVEAGRLVANGTLSRMMSNPYFFTMLEDAINEYRTASRNIITDQMDLPIDCDEKKDAPMFTIDGRRATKDSRGIVVGKNRKIIVP